MTKAIALDGPLRGLYVENPEGYNHYEVRTFIGRERKKFGFWSIRREMPMNYTIVVMLSEIMKDAGFEI